MKNKCQQAHTIQRTNENFSKRFLNHENGISFASNSSSTSSRNEKAEAFHQENIAKDNMDAMVCFKEIVIAHTCATKSCFGKNARLPGNGYNVPYLKKLNTEQKIFVQHFRKIFIDRCLSEYASSSQKLDKFPTSDATTTTTKVTLIARTRSRTDLGLASSIPTLAKQLNLLPNTNSNSQQKFEFRIIAQDSLSAEQFLSAIHFDTDILIGNMGGSLIFLMLMKIDESTPENPLSITNPLSSSTVAEISGIKSCSFVHHLQEIKIHNRQNSINKLSSDEIIKSKIKMVIPQRNLDMSHSIVNNQQKGRNDDDDEHDEGETENEDDLTTTTPPPHKRQQ